MSKIVIFLPQRGNCRILLPRFFRKNSVKLTFTKKKFFLNWFDEKWIAWQQISRFSTLWCGNYGNSLSRIFGKNFVKITVLLNKLLKSWFDEIFFWWERISRFSTLCHTQCGKTRNSLPRKFFFVKSIYSKVL